MRIRLIQGCRPVEWWAPEGNGLAQDLHASKRFRVLAVFARRPKVLDGEHMLGKINQELFECSDRAQVCGLLDCFKASIEATRGVFQPAEDAVCE